MGGLKYINLFITVFITSIHYVYITHILNSFLTIFVEKHFKNPTRKTSGFKSLELKYWEINQATPKCLIDIFGQNLN